MVASPPCKGSSPGGCRHPGWRCLVGGWTELQLGTGPTVDSGHRPRTEALGQGSDGSGGFTAFNAGSGSGARARRRPRPPRCRSRSGGGRTDSLEGSKRSIPLAIFPCSPSANAESRLSLKKWRHWSPLAGLAWPATPLRRRGVLPSHPWEEPAIVVDESLPVVSAMDSGWPATAAMRASRPVHASRLPAAALAWPAWQAAAEEDLRQRGAEEAIGGAAGDLGAVLELEEHGELLRLARRDVDLGQLHGERCEARRGGQRRRLIAEQDTGHALQGDTLDDDHRLLVAEADRPSGPRVDQSRDARRDGEVHVEQVQGLALLVGGGNGDEVLRRPGALGRERARDPEPAVFACRRRRARAPLRFDEIDLGDVLVAGQAQEHLRRLAVAAAAEMADLGGKGGLVERLVDLPGLDSA